MPIPAECHSDDHVAEARFDAEPWFLHSSDDAIVRLAKCGWGGDHAADSVAVFMAQMNENVGNVFAYLGLLAHKKDRPGYECFIDPAAAMRWVSEHRPHLLPAAQSVIA